MSYRQQERADFRRLYKTLIEEFGYERGLKIIEVLTTELGGRRVTVPGFAALARELRAKRIQELYDRGFGVYVLAQRFGISPRQVEYDLKREVLGAGN